VQAASRMEPVEGKKIGPPEPEGTGGPVCLSECRVVLDGRADGAQDLADLRAQEDQGDDRHDRDEGEDQRVLGETLAFLVIPVKEVDDCGEKLHLV
jgi:hypothetical protein